MAIRYHYCNQKIFNIIIRDQTLRLSDMRKSNDFCEMELFSMESRGVGEVISQYMKSQNTSYDGFWGDLEKLLKYYTDMTDCFATCLSIGKDKLSQWERYGDHCKGLAIGFDEDKLNEYIDKIAESLMIPEDLEAEAGVQNIMRLVARKMEYKKIRREFPIGELVQTYERIKEYLIDCAFTKHIGFSEEKEYRIALIFTSKLHEMILNNNEFSKHVTSYCFDNQSEKRYIDLKFDPKIIKEVYLGPLYPVNEDNDDIQKFLNENGVYCDIIKSEIPYNPSRQHIK